LVDEHVEALYIAMGDLMLVEEEKTLVKRAGNTNKTHTAGGQSINVPEPPLMHKGVA